MIKILDSTLRDGGYLNSWTFGNESITLITENLIEAGIDFVECGFLKECSENVDKTFYKTPFSIKGTNAVFMVNFGEYDLKNLPEPNNSFIRIAFKKSDKEKALEYINNLVKLGWNVFANPMGTNTYSKEELELLLKKVNKIKPYALSIVDTFGNMYEKDVRNIFEFIDSKLSKEISLCFHSHNSMQLSFSNTKALLRMNINREIIIDSCVYGMGRGAGNLCTELIIKYLNDNYSKDYKILPILKNIEIIKPIYEKNPWGYSTPYYLAAIHGCHPNYAGYLVSQGFSNDEIDKILSSLPEEKKISFNQEFIEYYIKKKEHKCS